MSMSAFGRVREEQERYGADHVSQLAGEIAKLLSQTDIAVRNARQLEIARQLARLDMTVYEYGVTTVVGDTSLTVQTQTRQLTEYHGILTILPTGTTSATLYLGKKPTIEAVDASDTVVLDVQNTTMPLAPIRIPVKNNEPRTLTWAPALTAGQSATLLMWGIALPTSWGEIG